MSKVKKRAEELLIHWAESELLNTDGGPALKSGKSRHRDRQTAGATLAAAYLATSASGAAALDWSETLLGFAWQGLRSALEPVKGRRGSAVESTHFTIRPLFDAYQLLRPLASKRDRKRLDARFAGLMEKFARALEPRFRAHGMNDLDLGTGLNHTVCWAALLCQGAALLGEPKWKRPALAWARRVAESQDESGYVSEHVGPSVLYDCLTLQALGRIHLLSGDRKVGASVEKLARFLVHCVYPDLRTVATFDERGRGTGFLTAPVVGFQAIPEGRRLFERTVERGWELDQAGKAIKHLVGSLATSLMFLQDGPSRMLPCERKRALFRAGKKALIRRRAPWFYVLSAFGNPPPTHNVFFHERTSIMSIYHDHAGRIVGGGNDRAPEYAAFSCHESDWIYYCIPRSGAVHAGRGADTLALDYGAADLTVKVRVLSRNRLVLTVENDLRERRDKCFLNLQLPLEGVKRVSLGTEKSVTLKGRRKLRHHKSAGLLDTGCWRIEAPPDSVFVWPHHPYVPYPRRARSAESVGFLRIPLAPVRNTAEVRITVKS
ncbi:MAG: hypothetical protein KAX80_04055 [Planctomycetes bacterium]|nr:hypothetical protein [Planctomycetota bacterium]